MIDWFLRFSRLTAAPLFLLLAPPAAGHAIVVESTPAHGAVITRSPPVLSLRFNAKIEPALTRVRLEDAEGKTTPVALRDNASREQVVITVPELASGNYSLRYKVMARDGHVTEGRIQFTILNP